MVDHVTFVGFFFVFVLLVAVLFYAFTVIPPIRTLGREEKPQPQMVEYVYTNQFAPLLGYRIRPTDFTTPEKNLYDMSGNLI
jgi:hypothetical protein